MKFKNDMKVGTTPTPYKVC